MKNYTVKYTTIGSWVRPVTDVRGYVYIGNRKVGEYTWTDVAEKQKDDCPYAFSLTGYSDWKYFPTQKAMTEYVQLNLLNEKEFWQLYSDALSHYEERDEASVSFVERLEKAYPVWTENFTNWCDLQPAGPLWEDHLPPCSDGKWIK